MADDSLSSIEMQSLVAGVERVSGDQAFPADPIRDRHLTGKVRDKLKQARRGERPSIRKLANTFVPSTRWIPSYGDAKTTWRAKLGGDLNAGITTGVMLIPQGMAYALLAGLPAQYGLYSAFFGTLVYAILGTSGQLSVAPVAMVSLLTRSALSGAYVEGTSEYNAAAVALALAVGVLQLLLGVLKLGFIVEFMAHPVLSAFTAAAALLIGLSQLKDALGISVKRSKQLHVMIYELFKNIGDAYWVTCLITLLACALLLFYKYAPKRWGFFHRYIKIVPATLIVVVAGTLAVSLGGLAAETTYVATNVTQTVPVLANGTVVAPTPFYVLSINATSGTADILVTETTATKSRGVAVVGAVPPGLAPPSVPSLRAIGSLLLTATIISLVGFMESMAVAKRFAAENNYELDASQELVALGAANLIGSFFSCYPMTGGFSRTAVNAQAGAKTPLASLLSSLVVLVTLYALTSAFFYLPKAVLAAIIMVAVFPMVRMGEVLHLWRVSRRECFLWVLTFCLTVFVGIELGIGISIGVSLVLVLARISRPHYAIVGRLPGTTVFRNVRRYPEAIVTANVVVMRWDAPLFFANAATFKEKVRKVVAQNASQPVDALVLDCDSLSGLDTSAVDVVSSLCDELEEQQIRVLFAGVRGPVRDVLTHTGLRDKIGTQHFFNTVFSAVQSLHSITANIHTHSPSGESRIIEFSETIV